MSTLNDEELLVVNQMRINGGSFVKSLAECFVHAYQFNKAILKNAFRKYWNDYLQMAKQNHDKKENAEEAKPEQTSKES